MILPEQEEELESFSYLYTEDELIILDRDPVHIQVRVSSNLENRTSHIKALLDLTWGENYPHEKPTIQIISIDIDANTKEQIVNQLLASCEDCMDMAMTLVLSSSLVELLNTAHETKLSKMKGTTETSTAEVVEETKASVTKITTPAQESKTKAQKRREQNNWQKVGELPRGYNWVDLVSHLRKTADSKA